MRGPYPQAAVVCFIHWPERGTVLLIKKQPHKHDGGRWGCPGGKQEFGESSVAAAWREGVEEVGPGFNRENFRHKGVISLFDDYVPEIGKHYLCLIHLFEVRAGRAPRMINAEPAHHSDVAWFPVDALPSDVTSGFRQVTLSMARDAGPGPGLGMGEVDP